MLFFSTIGENPLNDGDKGVILMSNKTGNVPAMAIVWKSRIVVSGHGDC